MHKPSEYSHKMQKLELNILHNILAASSGAVVLSFYHLHNISMTNKVSFAIATKTVNLPSFPWSEVLVKKISVWKKREIQQKYNLTAETSDNDASALQAFFEMIANWIVSRNFVDADWNPVEINEENVSELPEWDVRELMSEIIWNDNAAKLKNG